MSLRYVIAVSVFGTSAAVGLGQVPAVPAVPAIPVAPAVPSIAGVPASPARNLWSFFMLTPDQKAACAAKKDKFCRSQFGLLLNNVAKPASAITGGILPGCCPPSATDPLAPKPEDLKKPATEAEGAAARIKELEAGAPARRAAVRYLGTVNCKRFPEAETALIGALRTDTNECVRFEAAMALARGCCCSTKTIKALTLTVDGTDTDGNPPETSARVRTMAAQALARCCGTVETSTPPKEPPVELPPEKPTPEATARRIEAVERERALADGRKAWTEFQTESTAPNFLTGRRTVVDTLRYAIGPTAPPPSRPSPPAVAVPTTSPALVVVPASATVPVMTPAVVPVPTATPAPQAGTLPPTGRRGLFDILSASSKPAR